MKIITLTITLAVILSVLGLTFGLIGQIIFLPFTGIISWYWDKIWDSLKKNK
jgi:hypothetical protein